MFKYLIIENMIEIENKYHERYVRWQDKTRDQLSFFNNLLLTLSIGFLSFSYDNLMDTKIYFNFCHPQFCTTLFVLSFISIVLSILVGIFCVFSRLLDFRITTHINQVRYWSIKYSNTTLGDSSLKKLKDKLPTLISLIVNGYNRIDINECKSLKNSNLEDIGAFKADFKILRAISQNLGNGTWIKLKWQIFLFFIGIICFVISHFQFF